MQDIERYFQEMKCEEYAKVVRKIQDAEREKLLVVSIPSFKIYNENTKHCVLDVGSVSGRNETTTRT